MPQAGDRAIPVKLAAVDAALAHWGPDGNGLWHDEHCGLGQRLLFNTPEALLTGQGGNATVSWTSAPALRSRLAAFRHEGVKEGIRRSLRLWALWLLMNWRMQRQTWSGAIHADFARRIQLPSVGARPWAGT
jgi:hypothetical protein